MFITLHNIVHYLLERGFVSPSDIVHNQCTVTNSSSRNRCFKVAFQNKSGVFVKQSRPSDPTLQTCLEIEACCGREFQASGLLSEHVPQVLGYDIQRGVLCSALVAEAESLRQFCRTHATQRLALASALGDVLAKFHSTDAAQMVKRLPPRAQHRVPTTLRDDLTGVSVKIDPVGISARIRQYPDYAELIRNASKLWNPDGLCHGDIRWDNILIKQTNSELGLSIIDWELAGGGDSAWDVAGVVEAYLVDWVGNILELDELRDLVNNFLIAYISRRGQSVRNATFLRRVSSFAGCRLVQSTFEHHQFGTSLGESGLQLLQLSWNVLRDPEATERELLKISKLFDGSGE